MGVFYLRRLPFVLAFTLASTLAAQDFHYLPPGDLISGSGTGLSDCDIHSPTAIPFPIRQLPAFAKSQVYNDPEGLCLPADRYNYPWRDSFCECRSRAASATPECPAQGANCSNGFDGHHQGIDIVPRTCLDSHYEVIAVATGDLELVNSHTVELVPVNNPEITYRYLHMSNVVPNGRVNQGDVIGTISNVFTDETTAHLHFEILIDDRNVSPYMTLLDSYRREINSIQPGSQVMATKVLRVHPTPASSSWVLVDDGSLGTVVEGYVVADFQQDCLDSDGAAPCCFRWWKVNWESGESGWSMDNYLTVTGGQCTPSSAGSSFVAEATCDPPPPPQVPDVTTNAATNVTQQSAALNLTVNPHGRTTFVWFDWGTSTNLGRETTPQRDVGAGTSPFLVSITLDQLTCGTLYYFRARARNTVGGAPLAQIRSFQTDPCGGGGDPGTIELVEDPSFEQGDDAWWVASPAFYIDDDNHPRTGDYYAFLTRSDGSAGNNLSGGMISHAVTIPANATDADLRFYYSIESQETTSSTIFDYVDVYLVRPVNQKTKITTISNLNETGTAYARRSVDLSSSFYGDEVQIFFAGFTDGSLPTKFRIDDVSLEVDLPEGGPPDVVTQDEDQVTSSSARLNMTVNPDGDDTTVWFDLEANDSTPNDDTEHIEVGSGSVSETVSLTVFGLDCDTLYYFRANGENSHGSDVGGVRSFTTSACSGGEPHADTDAATNVTKTSATLNADVDPNGLRTQAWFEWGDDPGLGQETPHESVGSGTSNVDFSQTISGLTCGTMYYFENHASNSAGEDDDETLDFTTDSCDLPSPSDELLLFASRQACAGTQPAVLLGWTMPPGADRLVTVRRSDGHYVATVNTDTAGPMHDVQTGLVAGNAYRFTVETLLNGAPIVSNEVLVPIASDECSPLTTAADRPHRPLFWVYPPYCEDGVAKVRLGWSDAVGAQSYSVSRVGAFMDSATFNGITVTGLIDAGVTPGGGASYSVSACNNVGATKSWNVGVVIPGTVCSTSNSPGAFTAGAEDPVCNQEDSDGTIVVRWNESPGASADYRTFKFRDHGLNTLGDNKREFFEEFRHVDPGVVGRDVVQAESATTPGAYREAYPVARLVPLDICGGGTLPPSIENGGALYIRTDQALLRANILANGTPTTAYIEWGLSTAYEFKLPERVIGAGSGFVTLSYLVSGLSCGTTYHFRIVAINESGRTEGVDQSFTTLACDDGGVSPPLAFYTVTPCRVADTRQAPVPIYPGIKQTFTVSGVCGVPATAKAVSINATAVAGTSGGHITLFPADQPTPSTSTINFQAGQVRANNAVLGLSADGRLAALASLSGGFVHLIIDVNGYFAEVEHPMEGVWQGLIAGYTSTLYIDRVGGEFRARVSMEGANEPIEDLVVISVTETEFRAYRPLDNNAELRLLMTQPGPCLNGEYIELGTSRPVSLCKVL